MSQDIELPSFNFTAPVTVSDAEAAKSLNADQITPYTEVTLEVLKCEWRGVSEKDSTWGNFQLFMGLPGTILDAENKGKTSDGKGFAQVIRHFLTVPLTSKNLYNEETAPRMAQRLVKFLNAAGYPDVSIGAYGDVVAKRFTKFSEWKGQQFNCFVGYTKEHIGKDENGKFFIADKKGKPYKGVPNNSFLQREAAEGAAIKYEIDTDKSFLNIIRFSPVGTSTIAAAKGAEAAPEVDDEEY